MGKGNGADRSLFCFLDRFEIYADFRQHDFLYTGGRTDDEDRVTHSDTAGLYCDLGYPQIGEIIGDLADIGLLPGGLVAVNFGPFSQAGTLVITAPESAIEYLGQFCFQGLRLLVSGKKIMKNTLVLAASRKLLRFLNMFLLSKQTNQCRDL